MNKQSEWEKYAKKLPPEEWIRRIKKIPRVQRDVRIKVASIIFWDYSDGTIGWTPFISVPRLWSNDRDLSQDSLAKALCYIGYPKEVAQKRALCQYRLEVPIGGVWDGVTHYKENVKDASTRRHPGAEAALFAICEQAIEDVKSLVASGVIVDGSISPNWPSSNANGVVGYHGRSEVAHLIKWVTGKGMGKLMKDLGIYVDQEDILTSIGFPLRNTKVA